MSELFTELGEALRPNPFKIDQGIPCPERNFREHKRYPLHKMELGNSFKAASEYNIELLRDISAQCAAWAWRQKDHIKFSVHKFEDGIRVWRVE